MATLKLYALDCGRFRLTDEQFDAFAYGITSADTDVREVIAPCYVVEHEEGRLLWDGGLVSTTADVEGWHDGGGFEIRLDRTLGEQLQAIGLSYSSFDYMAFSHLHFDHVGVANEIEGARLLIQRAEYGAAFADDVLCLASFPLCTRTYGMLTASSSTPSTTSSVTDGFASSRRLATHPGHQVLLVDLERTGPIVLSGDLYHYQLSRQRRAVPSWNFDRDVTLASMESVERFLEETGAELWIQHEPARFEQVAQAPAFND